MSDPDAVVGRLYRALLDSEGVQRSLVAIITALKAGEMSIDRIAITDAGVEVRPALAVVPRDEGDE